MITVLFLEAGLQFYTNKLNWFVFTNYWLPHTHTHVPMCIYIFINKYAVPILIWKTWCNPVRNIYYETYSGILLDVFLMNFHTPVVMKSISTLRNTIFMVIYYWITKILWLLYVHRPFLLAQLIINVKYCVDIF